MSKSASVEKPRAAGAAPEIEIPATPQWLEEVVEWWFAGFHLATRMPSLFFGGAERGEDLRRLRACTPARRDDGERAASRRTSVAAS